MAKPKDLKPPTNRGVVIQDIGIQDSGSTAPDMSRAESKSAESTRAESTRAMAKRSANAGEDTTLVVLPTREGTGMDIKELQQIISILKENDVTRFELEQKGVKLRLSRLGAGAVQESHNGHAAMQSFGMGGVQPAFPRQMDGGAALAPHHVQAPVSPAASGASQSNANTNPPVTQNTEHLTKVDSPLVGTFYRKPSPDAEPFVREGQMVRKGDTLCIVEAMKLMNEIEAPVSGRVERVLVPDAHVVEFGEVLFLIDATA